MIKALASPSVCVVDDEEADYAPIREALNSLHISSLHFKGDTISDLPDTPFSCIRLVFQDLHLTADVGKTAASHAAKIFTKLISKESAPVVVVIWSKYADQKVAEDGVPPEDEKTEAQLFKETLEEAEPAFVGRLIFVEMPKPAPGNRPDPWIADLRDKITAALQGLTPIAALWQWESVVKQAGVGICAEVTALAHQAASASGATLPDGLKAAMQLLAAAESDGPASADSSPRHLTSALAQLLVDQLEHVSIEASLAAHGQWLSEQPAGAIATVLPAKLNSLLLTAPLQPDAPPFLPGVVYDVTDPEQFRIAMGALPSVLVEGCFKGGKLADKQRWVAGSRPVVIEISPACDVAQGKRQRSILVAGLIIDADVSELARKSDAWCLFPDFGLRWAKPTFAPTVAALVFWTRYYTTLPLNEVPTWLDPWFRLREIPTAALRNRYAGSVSRVGYVSA